MTPTSPLAARLFAAGNGVLVCRYPVATDLPIPLGITAPAGLALLTWAFEGFGADGREAGGLLVLHDSAGLLAQGGTLTLETHFRDCALACPAPHPVAELPPPARAALGEAVLAAVTPGTLAALATLFPVVAPPIASRPVPASSPCLVLARDGDTSATLSGSTVPNHLLLRSATTWSCARVKRAALRFGPTPEISLTLAPAWGTPRGAPVETALLLGPGSVAPASVRRGVAR